MGVEVCMEASWVRVNPVWHIPVEALPVKPRDVRDAPPVELTAVWPRHVSDVRMREMFDALNKKYQEAVNNALFHSGLP